jgi:radical SAM family uncharacterized protein/radical SAM-linked protein
MSELRERLEREVLPLVSRPSRYIGGERNVPRKDPRDVHLTFLLAFPDVYEIGMSHLGIRVLYDILNRRGDVAAERTFAPWGDMEALMREKGIPLFSLETHTPASSFDCLAFTLQYELHSTNILTMLDLAGVPVRASERDDSAPFVLGGGPNAYNPEPIAPFFDMLAVGDGESVVLDLAELFLRSKEEGRTRTETLRAAAAVPGIYVPALYHEVRENGRYRGTVPVDDAAPKVVRRRVEPALGGDSHPLHPLVPVTEVTHDRLAIEIMRGCTRGCRFCSAGMVTRPVRERSVEDVAAAIREGIEATGYDEVSLVSLSSSDYSGLDELLRKLNEELFDKRVSISLPSLRADQFNMELADRLGRVRKAGLTFAPEAGTQRLRDVINKNETEENILDTVRAAFGAGWSRVKLYFMVGLPTETDEDVMGIAELVKRIREEARSVKRGASFNVSISPFVPRPHTPFQWERQDSAEETHRKERMLRGELRMKGVKLSTRDPMVSVLEGVLTRGDRRHADVIEAAWRMGARFDGWTESFDASLWTRAFEEAGVSPDEGLSERDIDAPLPWDHISGGVTKSFLLEERRRAYEGVTTPDCREATCTDCGACPVDAAPARTMPERAARQEPTDAQRFGRRARRVREGVGERFRIRYEKGGPARFLSHLDILRAVTRALATSGLPVAYTHGFNPHPKVSFSPSLPVGVTGEAEFFDVDFLRPVEADDVHRGIEAGLPEGLALLEARPLKAKTAVAAEAQAADYSVRNAPLLDAMAPDAIREAIERVRRTEEAVVERGSGPKRVRPRDGILELTLAEETPPVLRMRLAIGQKGALRPSDVLQLIAGAGREAVSLAEIHRSELLRERSVPPGLEPVA